MQTMLSMTMGTNAGKNVPEMTKSCTKSCHLGIQMISIIDNNADDDSNGGAWGANNDCF